MVKVIEKSTKLDEKTHADLLEAIQVVYISYLRLDILDKKIFAGKCSILDFIDETIDLNKIVTNQPHEITASVADIPFTVKLNKDENGSVSFEITTNEEISQASTPNIKPVKDYHIAEQINLLQKTKFTLSRNKKGKLCAGTSISTQGSQGETYQIGGGDKISLYQSHLSQLYNIYQYLKNERDNINNLLIALATGAGKTFIQGLWLLCLSIANLKGIFSVPNNLVKQFKNDDLKRLLPSELLDKIYVLSHQSDPDANKNRLNQLKNNDGKSVFIIASHEELLDNYYNDLQEIDNHVFLSFDEQHLITTHEARKLKLQELSKKFLIMSLTATPDQMTYKLAGEKPVATMSSKMKAQHNQGSLPILCTIKAKTARDKLNHAQDKDKTIKNKMQLKFADSFRKQLSSPIVTALEELPTLVFDQRNTVQAERISSNADDRWNYRHPAGDKLLIIVDNMDELINLNNVVRAKENFSSQDARGNHHAFNPDDPVGIYQDDNKKDRAPIYDLFGMDKTEDVPNTFNITVRHHVEKNIHKSYLEKRRDEYAIKTKKVAARNIRDQWEKNILQGLIEYLLSDLTGLSSIALNDQRKNNMDALLENVKNKIYEKYPANMTLQEIEESFKRILTYDPNVQDHQGIDEAGAKTVAKLLSYLVDMMRSITPSCRDFYLKTIINNWSLDGQVTEALKATNRYFYTSSFSPTFQEYLNNHLTLFLMDGVNGNMPFSHFIENKTFNYDEETGLLSDEAKNRKQDIVEILDDKSYQYSYRPLSMPTSEKVQRTQNPSMHAERIADNYFKKSFIGAYISNKKTEGFNDENLATVIQVIPHDADTLNNPEKVIQAAGRCRGLDETKSPIVIQALGRNVTPCFDLKIIEVKDNFYNEYFSSANKYKEKLLLSKAKEIKDKMVLWISNNKNSDGSFNKNALNKAIQTEITKSFREINNINGHDLKLSRKFLKKLLRLVQKEIKAEVNNLKAPFKESLITKILGGIIYFIARMKEGAISFTSHAKINILNIKTKGKLFLSKNKNNEKESLQRDQLYIKIQKSTTLAVLIEKSVHFTHFRNILAEKKNILRKTIKSEEPKFLNKNAKKQINNITKNKLVTAFSLWVKPEKQKQFIEAATRYNKWYLFLDTHQEQLKKLEGTLSDKNSSNERKLAFHTAFTTIPGIANLRFDDIIDAQQLPEIYRESQKKTFSETFISELTQFFEDPKFLIMIRQFIYETDFVHIEVIIQNSEFVKEFAHRVYHLIYNDSDDQNENYMKAVFDEFKQFMGEKNPALKNMTFVPDSLDLLKDDFKTIRKLFKEIIKDPTNHLNDAKKNEINTVGKLSLSQCISKFFNPNVQAEVEQAIEKYNDWTKFLAESKETLEKLRNNNLKDNEEKISILSQLFRTLSLDFEKQGLLVNGFTDQNFRNLNNAAAKLTTYFSNTKDSIYKINAKKLNTYFNDSNYSSYETAATELKTYFNTVKTSDIASATTKAVLSNSVSFFKSMLKTSTKSENNNNLDVTTEIMIQAFADKLSNPKFFDLLKPLSTKNQLDTISNTFSIPNQAKEFSRAFINKYEIKDPNNLNIDDPEKLLTMFCETFNETFATRLNSSDLQTKIVADKINKPEFLNLLKPYFTEEHWEIIFHTLNKQENAEEFAHVFIQQHDPNISNDPQTMIAAFLSTFNKTFTSENQAKIAILDESIIAARIMSKKISNNEFFVLLEPCFTEKNLAVMRSTLSQQKNAEKFSHAFIALNGANSLEDLKNKNADELLKAFLTTFNTLFVTENEKKVMSLDQSLEQGFTQLTKIFSDLEAEETDPMLFMTDDDIKIVNEEIKKHFIPCLIKLFESEHRPTVSKILDEYSNWPYLLKLYKKDFDMLNKFDLANTDLKSLDDTIKSLAYKIVMTIKTDTVLLKIQPDEIISYFETSTQINNIISSEVRNLANTAAFHSVYQLIEKNNLISAFYNQEGNKIENDILVEDPNLQKNILAPVIDEDSQKLLNYFKSNVGLMSLLNPTGFLEKKINHPDFLPLLTPYFTTNHCKIIQTTFSNPQNVKDFSKKFIETHLKHLMDKNPGKDELLEKFITTFNETLIKENEEKILPLTQTTTDDKANTNENTINIIPLENEIPTESLEKSSNGLNENHTLTYLHYLNAEKIKEINLFAKNHLSQLAEIYITDNTTRQTVINAMAVCTDWHFVLFDIYKQLMRQSSASSEAASNDSIFHLVINALIDRKILDDDFMLDLKKFNDDAKRKQCKERFFEKLTGCRSAASYGLWHQTLAPLEKQAKFIDLLAEYLSSPDFLAVLNHYYNVKSRNEIIKILHEKECVKIILNTMLENNDALLTSNEFSLDHFIEAFNQAHSLNPSLKQEIDSFNAIQSGLQPYINGLFSQPELSLKIYADDAYNLELAEQQIEKHKSKLISRLEDLAQRWADNITNYQLLTQDESSNFTTKTFAELLKISLHDVSTTSLIIPADDMLNEGSDEIAYLTNDSAPHLNLVKLNRLFAQTILPLIMHPAFLNAIDASMKDFTAQDFAILAPLVLKDRDDLALTDKQKALEYADKLMTFIQLLREGDLINLFKQYFDLRKLDINKLLEAFKQDDDQHSAMNQIPGIDMMLSLTKVFTEIVNCQKYFYRIDRANKQDININHYSCDSELVKKISQDLQNTHSNITYNPENSSNNKQLFVMFGINNSLSESNDIQKFSNDNVINTLDYLTQNINEINSENISDKKSDLSPQNEDKHITHSFNAILKNLQPLSSDDIKQPNCPQDAVVTLEKDATRDPDIELIEAYIAQTSYILIDLYNQRPKEIKLHAMISDNLIKVGREDEEIPDEIRLGDETKHTFSKKAKHFAFQYNLQIKLFKLLNNDGIHPKDRILAYHKECKLLEQKVAALALPKLGTFSELKKLVELDNKNDLAKFIKTSSPVIT